MIVRHYHWHQRNALLLMMSSHECDIGTDVFKEDSDALMGNELLKSKNHEAHV
jgi:hypothetical protein